MSQKLAPLYSVGLTSRKACFELLAGLSSRLIRAEFSFFPFLSSVIETSTLKVGENETTKKEKEKQF